MVDMFKKLAKYIKEENQKTNLAPMTLPFGKEFLTQKNKFLDKMTKKAVELYERQADIDNFTKLVLSDPENKNHNEIVDNLFEDGIVDPFVDDKLDMLARNEKFLKDLGLL